MQLLINLITKLGSTGLPVAGMLFVYRWMNRAKKQQDDEFEGFI